MTTTTRDPDAGLRDIPSVPEGGLSEGLVERLPAHVAPAPWESTVDALLWFHRSTPEALAALPDELTARPWPQLAAAGLISYREGPVGPYGEVVGAPALVEGGPLLSHVPFIAVDSETSILGGRRNWALPKVPARFDGDPGLPGRVKASGEGWEIAVSARARPRSLPAWTRFSCAQVRPDGGVETFAMTIHGRMRLGSVRVEHGRRSSLESWLLPGRHPAVFLSGRQTVSAPEAR